jgi:Flp pilus assembly protein TadD
VEINVLLAQGDEAFRRGDLASARLLYRRAYEANDGRGALGIGASYDPLFLRRYHVWTQFADPEEARIWYMRARDLGTQEARTRLKHLDAKTTR